MVRANGTSVLFVSGQGTIWRYDSATTWTQVHTGWDTEERIRAKVMGNKLMFYNGVNRNIFLEDKTGTSVGATVKELKALIEQGEAGGNSTSAAAIDDADITNWTTDTNVVADDIVFNITKGAYGLVTTVVSGMVQHTTIGSAATGLGQATGNQIAGDRYQILDLIELNILPTDGEDDNTGTAGPGTGATTVAVSGVNFLNTDIKAGDFISNTTRSAVAMVSSVATALTVTSVAGQVAGDSIKLLKPAMPIAAETHIHYGRAYYLDARDLKRIRISGPNDPQDMTADTGVLDTITYSLGDQQPQGDIIKAMSSYQRFFVVGGKKNVILYAGTDPIADTTAAATD